MSTTAMIAIGVYMLALNMVIEMVKRIAVRREWNIITGYLELWTLFVAGASGPLLAPWVWGLVAPDTTPPALPAQIFIGVAAAGLALSIYPAIMEPMLKKAGVHVSKDQPGRGEKR